ncbi:MAG: CinA family protein [Pseudomonadales bacterium]|nr:CinA family protein [Pseudomonadales bacterium]
MDTLTLCQTIAALCREKDLRLVTAESCTGGLIAAQLTDLPGSSAWFYGGFVTYTPEAKVRLLGVDQNTIARFGVVSEPVAVAMAKGALQRTGADIAVSVTGIAGPTGGEPDLPAGTVWLAWMKGRHEYGLVQASAFDFSGDRQAVRCAAVAAALEGLKLACEAF